MEPGEVKTSPLPTLLCPLQRGADTQPQPLHQKKTKYPNIRMRPLRLCAPLYTKIKRADLRYQIQKAELRANADLYAQPRQIYLPRLPVGSRNHDNAHHPQ